MGARVLSPAWVSSACRGGRRKALEARWSASLGQGCSRGDSGYQVQGRMSCSQCYCRVKMFPPTLSGAPRVRGHSLLAPRALDGGAGLQALQASLADIFLWKDFKRAVKNQKPHRVTNSGVSGWWRPLSSPLARPRARRNSIKRQSVSAQGVRRASSVLRSRLFSSPIVDWRSLSTQCCLGVFWGWGVARP